MSLHIQINVSTCKPKLCYMFYPCYSYAILKHCPVVVLLDDTRFFFFFFFGGGGGMNVFCWAFLYINCVFFIQYSYIQNASF